MKINDYFSESIPVDLTEMLNAREYRVKIQQELIAKYKCTIISFTLNIPGEYKNYPLASKAFDEGVALINQQISNLQLKNFKTNIGNFGFEGFFSVLEEARKIKLLMMEIEQSHDLGRIFDIDVIDANGICLRGEDYGRKERQCLMCSNTVWNCARIRKHSAADLAHKTASIIENYFREKFSDRISISATKALLYEVSITPKPGLVDRQNNGAHKDMNIFTFIDSSVALIPYFKEITNFSLNFEYGPEKILSQLRFLGKCAEHKMYDSTKGVNTHKGLIFSLAIVAVAAGYLFKSNNNQNAMELSNLCKRIAHNTPMELELNSSSKTSGEQIFNSYGLTGVRGECSKGFPNVMLHAYPVLKNLITQGYSINDAGIIALLNLLAYVDDTNIINRSNLEDLKEIQSRLKLAISTKSNEELIDLASQLDTEFIMRNISPGGCADLLAISLMIYFICDC